MLGDFRDRWVERYVNEALRQDASTIAGKLPSLKPASKLWPFVNSAFGIFVCSSIFLGLLSFAYAQWVQWNERQRSIEQLDLELSLRIREVDAMAKGEMRNRYSNLVNVRRVMDGDTSKFYLHKPLFNEFQGKNTTTLMWQLYLLVPASEKQSIRQAIKTCLKIDDLLKAIRYKAASSLPHRPEAKSEEAEEKLEDQEDILTKEFGQSELYQDIATLAKIQRWQLTE